MLYGEQNRKFYYCKHKEKMEYIVSNAGLSILNGVYKYNSCYTLLERKKVAF